MRDRSLGWREWLLLAGCVALLAAGVVLRGPVERFGRYHDDTLYAASARAIADGQGYVQPNLPGAPQATKYPPAYPYLLALAMTLVTEAYEDPAGLWVLSLASVAWALVVAYLYMRSWRVPAWAPAVALVLCVTQEILLVISGALLSDGPYMALALTALYLADRENPGRGALAAAALAAGLAVLTRTVGVAIPAAIVLAFLLRKQYRNAVVFGLAAAPFVIYGAAAKLFAAPLPEGVAQGYSQTLAYYADYAAFWRASVPDFATLTALLSKNLGSVLRTPAEIALGSGPDSYLGRIGWVTLTAAALSGLYRQVRQDRWRPVHFALGATFLAALLWNYEIGDRLLLVFAPFFALGLAIEFGHMATNFWKTFREAEPAGERAVSAVFLVLLAAFALYIGQRTVRTHIQAASTDRYSYDEKYRELYGWIRANTRPEDRFLGIDDGLCYLRTGRQGMWPLALTTQPRYKPDPGELHAQMDLLPDVAEETGARYVIQADHDYAFAPLARERWLEWTAGLPVVFESPRGAARVLDLGCLPECAPRLTQLSAPDGR